MAINCWSIITRTPGCVSGYYDWGATISPPGINPLLPIPAYVVPTTIWGGEHCAMNPGAAQAIVNASALKLWGHFCDPPRAPYPIVDIGAWPVTPTPIALDIAREPSIAPLPEYYMDRGFAVAVRINPVSKCLPYLMFHNAYNQVAGKKTIVEIRKNNPATNLPMGVPGDGNIFGRVTVEFTTDYANYAVPINTILDEIDVPVWIVLYSEDYACSSAFEGTANRRLKLYKSDTGTNNVALFNQNNGCTWAMDNTVKSIALASYKATACNGTVVVTDYAFAMLGNPPIYLNDNCFVRLAEVEGANVSIGVKYTNPDPVRTWKRVRFSFAYKKPDLRYFTGVIDLFDVAPGQYETFFDMNELYFPGEYDELQVSARVVQV